MDSILSRSFPRSQVDLVKHHLTAEWKIATRVDPYNFLFIFGYPNQGDWDPREPIQVGRGNPHYGEDSPHV